MDMKDVNYKVQHVPGEVLHGLNAELAALTDSDPYNLARISIGNTGFELVFDDRNAPETVENVIKIADRIEKSATHYDEVISLIDDAHGVILDMAKYMEPEVLRQSEAFNRLITAMPDLVEKLGGVPTRRHIKGS